LLSRRPSKRGRLGGGKGSETIAIDDMFGEDLVDEPIVEGLADMTSMAEAREDPPDGLRRGLYSLHDGHDPRFPSRADSPNRLAAAERRWRTIFFVSRAFEPSQLNITQRRRPT